MKLSVIFMLIAKRVRARANGVTNWPWVDDKDYWCFEENISAVDFIERSKEVLNTAFELVIESFVETLPSLSDGRDVVGILHIRQNAVNVFAQAMWWACRTYNALFPGSLADNIRVLYDLPARQRLETSDPGRLDGIELWLRALGDYNDRSLLTTLAVVDVSIISERFKTSDQIGVEKFVNQIREFSDQLPTVERVCYGSRLLEYVVTNVRWLIGTQEEQLTLVNLDSELG